MATLTEVATELSQYFTEKGSDGITTQEVVAFMVGKKIVVGEVMNVVLHSIGAEKVDGIYRLNPNAQKTALNPSVDTWVRETKKPSVPGISNQK